MWFIIFIQTIKVPASIVIGFWIITQLINATGASSDGVAYFAHIGGFVFGYIAIKYFFRGTKARIYADFEEVEERDIPFFRKNRTSIAVLDDSVSEDELLKLSDDIFNYYGLGCRSVTKLYLPFNFDLDRLFNAFYKHKELINHNKYMNNYDYNRSIFLLQKITFLENGFLILKEDENLFSPVSVVHYEFYKDLNQLNSTLKHQTEKIQCRVGTGGIPFGTAQQPKIWDYADGVDTIDFLTKIFTKPQDWFDDKDLERFCINNNIFD